VSLSDQYEDFKDFLVPGDRTGSCATTDDPSPARRNCLAVSLISREARSLGVLQVSHTEDGRDFDSQDQAALTQLAHFASAAIEQSISDMALRSSEARFRAAVAAVEGIVWTNDAAGRMVGEQPGWSRLTGQTEEQYKDFGWTTAVHPEDVEPSVDAWNAAVAAKQPLLFEHRVKTVTGEWRLFAIRAIPVLDSDSKIKEWVGVHTDITEKRYQEEELRLLNERLEQRVNEAVAERVRIESALRQAQKMESLGKLTGGVAHDFNNLLQVISGNLQLLSREVPGNETAARRVQNALAGVTRGAKLASQLLAFGRRQPLEPKVVNVSSFIRGMDDMLRRTLGEEIEIETVIAGGLWNTLIDPGQVENAILNLAINARDAMNGQGRLTIEASNAMLDSEYCRLHSDVEPGQYVMIAVTDTGAGIPKDVLERVFEPFFSTKPEGKGTGLGLSMVYGFVKQSAGHVKIYSEVGEGTTVKLYLPRSVQAQDVLVDTRQVQVKGGSETILVVEDDEDVREIAVSLLSELGYQVLTARDAASALTVVESGVPIDLLFTDVVMPGPLRSPELARRAKESLPDLAILFTSGYTENAIVHNGRLDAGVELLGKPYTREALARKVRHVLANQTQQSVARRQWQVGRTTGNAAHSATSKRATVLLVEDDVLIRSCTREMLSEFGHRIIEASNAEEALRVIQGAEIDILITDINLPRMSGLELARRAKSCNPHLKIVFATGDQGAALDAGEASAFVLIKPYCADQLQNFLAELPA
jgi:PAS domain S-box-containing protein